MTSDKMLLLCNPDEPGWFNASASVTSVGDCGHQIVVSASGLGLLLTTPGLSPICLRCIPPDDGEETEYILPPEIRAQVEAEIGEPITDEFMERMKAWVETNFRGR